MFSPDASNLPETTARRQSLHTFMLRTRSTVERDDYVSFDNFATHATLNSPSPAEKALARKGLTRIPRGVLRGPHAPAS